MTELSRTQATRDLLSSLMGLQRWTRETQRWLHAHESRTSLLALALVDEVGPARVGELAEAARIDVSVVSRKLSHLEKEGLVRRAPDPDDGRAHRLSLTPAGHAALDQGRDRVAGRVADRLEGWGTDEIADLSGSLDRFLADVTTPQHTAPSAPTPEDIPA